MGYKKLSLMLLACFGLTGLSIFYLAPRYENQLMARHAYERDGAYIYHPSEIDMSNWRRFEPFRGFSLHYPSDWALQDSGEFGTPALQPHLQVKRTYFFSPGIITGTHDNLSRNGGLVKGARIEIRMIARNKDTGNKMKESDCPSVNRNYEEQELMEFDGFLVCRNRVFGPHFDSGYRYNTHTGKMSYDLSITYNGDELPASKDYYRTVAETIIASFDLY